MPTVGNLARPLPGRVGIRIVALVGVALLALPLTSVDASAATPRSDSGVCAQTSSGPGVRGARIEIRTPDRGAAIDEGKTPEFTIAGIVSVPHDQGVRVDVYGDSTLVGSVIGVDSGHWGHQRRHRERSHEKANAWSVSTTADAGKHVLTACAYVGSDVVARASVTVTVTKPATDATVFTPDTVQLTPAQTAAVKNSTDTQVTLSGTQPLTVGQIIVTGPSQGAPTGLMRRITAVTSAAGSTVLTTVPAALDEVFWQIDVTSSTDVAPTTTPSSPTPQSRPAAAPTASQKVSAQAQLGGGFTGPEITVGGSEQVAFNVPGVKDTVLPNLTVTANGSVSAGFKATVTFQGRLDWSLKITWPHAWSPLPTMEHFLLRHEMTRTDATSATLSGKGQMKAKYAFPATPLAVIPVGPGVVLTVAVKPSISLSSGVSGSLTWGGKTVTESVRGVEKFRGAPTQDLNSDKVISRTIDPLKNGAAVSVSAELSAQLALDLVIDGTLAAGPFVEAGIGETFTYPCPGSDKIAQFVRGGFFAKVTFLDIKDLLTWKTTVAELKVAIDLGPPPGCGDLGALTVAGTAPAGAVSKTYGTQLEASGGTAPYTWSADSGLPPGLTLSSSGYLSGTPTVAGSYTVQVTVVDAAGLTAKSKPVTVAVVEALRFSGNYGVTQTVVSIQHYVNPADFVGRTGTVQWTFTPTCAAGSCVTNLTRTRFDGGTADYVLTPQPDGSLVSAVTDPTMADCLRVSDGTLILKNVYTNVQTVTVRPTAWGADGVVSTWTGSIEDAGTPSAEGVAAGCVPASEYISEVSPPVTTPLARLAAAAPLAATGNGMSAKSGA